MSTPTSIIQIMVDAGERADETHPGLRERDANAWMQIAAGYACFEDARYGRKARSPNDRISPDTMAHRVDDDSFYAVSIIRDDPKNGNPWRVTPIDHGEVTNQYFVEVPPLDPGTGEPPDDCAARLDALEESVRDIQTWIESYRVSRRA